MGRGGTLRRVDGAALRTNVLGRERTFCCHRATFSGAHPPNSLAAVAECVGAGVPRLEVDVRFLRDDAMLVFHDGMLDGETTGSGLVDALDAPGARQVRLREHPETGLCFLEDVVVAMAGGPTLLQVDLKLMRPISPARVRLLAEALAPLEGRLVVGSQAHWNLRPLATAGLPVALDPTLHLHRNERRRPGDGLTPARKGIHGLWDDAPLAQIRHATAAEYLAARVEDLAGLAPAAVEWMVDIETLRYASALGVGLGEVLAERGIALAAWTMRDEGPERSRMLLQELFEIGATTIITDYGRMLAGYVHGAG